MIDGDVRVNVAAPVSKTPPSVPIPVTTYGPGAADPTTKSQTPVIPPTTREHTSGMERIAPAIETEESDGTNPLPVTETVSPATPVEGVSAREGDVEVTRNEAEAVWPCRSVALTVVPLVPRGTRKEQLNAPKESVVSDPLRQTVIATESKISDSNPADAEKPDPETTTKVPTGPLVGVTFREGDAGFPAPPK
ncbi:MAG: hypothetical protein WBG19_02770 [Thermoplasmata archaeon]